MKVVKNIFFILLFLFLHVLIFSQDNSALVYIEAIDTVIRFEDNHKIMLYKFDRVQDTSTEKHGVYTVSVKYGVPFITIVWENKETETFLMLSNRSVCFLYKTGMPNPHAWGVSSRGFNRSEAVFSSPINIRASSVLIENDRSYSPDQINRRLGQAWAEGKNGQGIHEKLFINPPYFSPTDGCATLYISIGFVSYEKPYLYEENSRPKRLQITVANKFSFSIDLEDTPNFQTIMLPQKMEKDDVLVIEILDVYPGTKYEDTCINCILYDMYPADAGVTGTISQ